MTKKISEPEYIVYTRNGETALVDEGNMFVYHTSVFLHYKSYFSLCNSKYFSSPVYLEGVVSSFNKTKNIQICSELFSAPEQWLIDNNYTKYNKPQKIRKTNLKTEGNDK